MVKCLTSQVYKKKCPLKDGYWWKKSENKTDEFWQYFLIGNKNTNLFLHCVTMYWTCINWYTRFLKVRKLDGVGTLDSRMDVHVFWGVSLAGGKLILYVGMGYGEQVSVVMWLAPWPPVRETRVEIPEQHGNLVKFILVWVFFNPSGILTQP